MGRTRVFVSYRRGDAAGYAGRLADSIRELVGDRGEVMRDLDGLIGPGENFRTAIADAVAQADVLLAVIGRRWLEARDAAGSPRLDDDRDMVRLELLGAAERGIPVIPILVEGMSMPGAEQLPAELVWLADRNAVELSDARWREDCERLANTLRESPDRAPQAPSLPTPSTSLVGREREIELVAHAIEGGGRAVTLTGPGGIGKTRIAIESARRQAPSFDKVVFCDLTTLDSPEQVLPAIARAAGVDESVEGRVTEGVARSLGPVDSLLVVDNAEHVVGASPELGRLLSSAPGLRLLVTSRAPLRISGERELPIAPLDAADAVDLFADRARAVRPDLALSDLEAKAASEICARLDGLPLAIELAAARVRLLSPADILDHLGERLALLTHGPQDLPERQQTVRATIEWSCRLLDDADQALLARMSVFAAGATIASVREVCAPDLSPIGTLDRLQSLAENSLVFTGADAAGDERYRMLELIREFSRELLEAEDEAAELGRRHAEHFASFVDREGPRLEDADQIEALARFDAEYPNLVEALAWARGNADGDLEARMLGWLGDYWYFRGQYAEPWPWLEHALELEGVAPAHRAAVLRSAGGVRTRMGDIEMALALYEESLEICESLGDLYGQARALSGLEGCHARTEDYAAAEQTALRALELVRRIGDLPRVSFSAANAGYTAMQRGDLGAASELFTEALDVARGIGHPEAIANAEQNLGLLALLEGDLDTATSLTASGLEGSLELREHLGILCGLVGAAAIASGRGDPEAAAMLIGLVDAELGARDYVFDPVEATVHDRTLEALRTQLEPAAFTRARDAGADSELLETVTNAVADLRAQATDR